ncbi:MAG: PAS domain S-box protein [Kofleriaceae bacterium]
MGTLDETTFLQLVEESPDAMFVAQAGTDELLYVNPPLIKLLGYHGAYELLGRHSLEALVHPDDHHLVIEAEMRRQATGVCSSIELRWLRKDRTSFLSNARATFIFYEDKPCILVTARHDVQVRTLEAAVERSSLLFESAPQPIVVFDRNTLQYLAVNQAACKLYGYSRDEMMRMRLLDVKYPEDAASTLTAVDSIAHGTIKNTGVMRHRAKDGREILIDITAHAFEYDGHDAMMSIGIDVTQRATLEGQLRQAQKMEAIGQLAGGVAHDFNNLLGVVLANVELAIEGAEEGTDISEELREIEVAAERATALTRQLLAFSRKQPRRTETISIDQTIINCEKMLSRIVGEDIEMSMVLSPELASISADASQLEQVLVNLVINARDAMPTGGLVIIEASNVEIDDKRATTLGLKAGAYVELSVQDTGTGMDAATKARIFEPFFTTKAVGKGTGLGLSTVFGIVNQSSGAIEVESELGRGTCFRVVFPAVESHADQTTEMPIEHARGTETVLLVEDDPKLRSVLRRHLTALGYTAHDAPHGHAALEILRKAEVRFDLLLTDLVMPGLDGRSLAVEALREHPELKVVFMSGYTEHAAVKTARFEHDHFVEKPFTSVKLSHVIRRALA